MCFLIGATGPGVTSTGEALIGGVSDDPYNFRTFVRYIGQDFNNESSRFQAHIGTELRYIDSVTEDTPPPFEVEKNQPSRGINSAGLAFTCALAVEREIKSSDNLEDNPKSFAELTNRMMKECTNVDEAEKLLLSAKCVTPAFSVVLADACGNLTQIEVGRFGGAVLHRYSKTEPGVVIAVNCHQVPELIPFNKPEAQISNRHNNNGRRLFRGWQLANQYRGGIDVDTISLILSDHANINEDSASNPLIQYWGHSICNHGTRSHEEYDYDPLIPCWGTVSAEIMQPKFCSFHYCYGWPCGSSPEFRDQLYQNRSWGKFMAFALPSPSSTEVEAKEERWIGEGQKPDIVEITTTDGDLTEAGKVFLL
uniref:Uncharacterized protein n=1 Tax=Aplanochytrium stocchinoi TaxID=215587 RepID=A0A7S3V0B2_9STRA|mmetsp:Transcript_18246/g.22501  ORF Transcript_18246/g.22501 Transcript_18246/m.22501 type:complete len:366 (+) Transcript_18246:190-1287(+)|eukprot:CAMPEP_0204833822 /NCGR_PEP_ID=MMETSP1346-20131115/17876_1 /ASSEMBLY_ACC=CAM_ASM_000771 /TAXON_ID=215587 /ORGANISM="Aplanochytrium stocchinoi, Strain GSBS06" /LENGTH=365 /DNA_ID=CAMNT_0051966631 /DNA_START=117 /DNA_END=1214 /DNA_ORIENTATION=-